jgi:hypothetical protein
MSKNISSIDLNRNNKTYEKPCIKYSRFWLSEKLLLKCTEKKWNNSKFVSVCSFGENLKYLQ